MRLSRTQSRGATPVAVFVWVAILAVLAPGRALADDVLGLTDPVEDVVAQATQDATQTVSDATQDATQTVSDATQDATQTVSDATQDATQTVNDATQDAAQTLNDATRASANGATEPVTPAGPNAPGPTQFDTRTGPPEEGDTLASRTLEWSAATQWRESVTVGSGTVLGASNAAFRPRSATSPGDDPCEADTQVVCLGLLYGLGDFADAGTKLLGTLALTGLGVLGLALLALALGIGGTAALVASRSRAVVAE